MCPFSNCSRTTTSRPARCSAHAAARPFTPAPTTTTSACLLTGGSLCCRGVLTSIAITSAELAARRARLREHLDAEGLTGAVLFDNYYVLYYAGFAFIPTERPIAFVRVAPDGERAMLVPRLEVEHARGATGIERIAHYDEFPGIPRAEEALRELLADMGIAGRIGADQDGYPWILGYRGPALSELAGAEVVRVAGFVEEQMAVKSEAEIALIRESAKWGNLAHRLLQQYTRAGLTETEVTQRASERGDDGDAPDARAALPRPEPAHPRGARRLSRSDRPRLGDSARAREQRRLPARATCSSPARARRCGATSRSSSGRW